RGRPGRPLRAARGQYADAGARRSGDPGHHGAARAQSCRMSVRRINASRRRARAGEAGFTLIEVLLATLLMTVILAALASVTAQWMTNWNRGMVRVPRGELLAMGLDRIVADLSVTGRIAVNCDAKTPLFEGSELVV